MNYKKLLVALACAGAVLSLTGCPKSADVVSKNLSVEADNFHIQRRVVFYNTIDSSYMMTIEGLCSLGNDDKQGELTITCEVGPDQYKKHFLGLSRNVTYFVEQMDSAAVSQYHYKVVLKPSVIIPDLSVN